MEEEGRAPTARGGEGGAWIRDICCCSQLQRWQDVGGHRPYAQILSFLICFCSTQGGDDDGRRRHAAARDAIRSNQTNLAMQWRRDDAEEGRRRGCPCYPSLCSAQVVAHGGGGSGRNKPSKRRGDTLSILLRRFDQERGEKILKREHASREARRWWRSNGGQW